MNWKPDKRTIRIDPAAVGARVRELRLARNWRQRDLAERIGVHHAVVSAIERGERAPTIQSAISLAVSLRRSLEFLLFGLARRGSLWRLAE